MIEIALRRPAALLPSRSGWFPLTALAWLAMVEVATAQPLNAAPPAKDYYLQYMLVALCIALGMLAALRPSPRRDPEGGGASWFSMAVGGHTAEGPTRPGERRREPHRGTKLLIMSILGFCCCCIISIVTMNMAKEDLAAMKAGRMDRGGESLTKIAYWICVGTIVLAILSILGNLLAVVLNQAGG